MILSFFSTKMKLEALLTKTRKMVPALGSNRSAWTCCIGFKAAMDDSNVSRVGDAGFLIFEAGSA